MSPGSGSGRARSGGRGAGNSGGGGGAARRIEQPTGTAECQLRFTRLQVTDTYTALVAAAEPEEAAELPLAEVEFKQSSEEPA
jgi:hypothetical protein